MVNSRVIEGLSREELRQIIEELGLAEAEGDPPSFGDIALRLGNLLPELPWREKIDPQSCCNAPLLSEIREPGFYNRGIILVGGRSQYTAGLETELARLSEVTPDGTQGTSLGLVLGTHGGATENKPARRLFEAIPLNDEQRRAVQSAMTAPFTVITGPPGTGKSQVVTSILVNAALAGERVLFASKNNKAVDVVYERANGLTSQPFLVRLGGQDEQRQKLLAFLTNLLATSTTPADETSLKEAEAEYLGLLRSRGENQANIDAVVAIRNKVDELDKSTEESRRHWPADVFRKCLNSRETLSLANARGLEQEHQKCQNIMWGFMGSIRWLFKRRKLIGRLNEALAACRIDAERLALALPPPADTSSRLAIYHTTAETLVHHIKVANCISEYGRELDRLSRATPIPELSLKDATIAEKVTDAAGDYLEAWSRCLSARLDQDSRRALSQYRAALQTLTSQGLSRQQLARLFREIENSFKSISKFLSCWCVANLSARGRVPFVGSFFDLVVIDEASQCDIASALPLLYRAKRAVIIGDPNQLQHIASLSERQDTELRRKHDLLGFNTLDFSYKQNSFYALALGFAGKASVIELLDHHRSHAHIIAFSNTHFYGGKLRIATDYRRSQERWQSMRHKVDHCPRVCRKAWRPRGT